MLDYDEDATPVVGYLLRHIKDEFEERTPHGSYIRSDTALRCDEIDHARADKPDISAIFVSFPYFDISALNPSRASKDTSLHETR